MLIASLIGSSANHDSNLSIPGFWSVWQYRNLPGFMSAVYASSSRICSSYGEGTVHTLLDTNRPLNDSSS